jgi:hypothetical protein
LTGVMTPVVGGSKTAYQPTVSASNVPVSQERADREFTKFCQMNGKKR